MFVAPSKLWSHTCSRIMVRERTLPAFAIRYSRTPYSFEVNSTRLPARFTCCERRSSSKSPIRSTLALVTGPQAKEGFDPNQQLGKSKRLCQVIVSTGFKVFDFVANRITGGQNQHWDLRLRFPDSVQNLTTREARKHQVKDDEVILIGLSELPASLAITSRVDCETLGSQPLDDKSGDLVFVFDDENAHFLTSPNTTCKLNRRE